MADGMLHVSSETSMTYFLAPWYLDSTHIVAPYMSVVDIAFTSWTDIPSVPEGRGIGVMQKRLY
jgi:hypothetical protein